MTMIESTPSDIVADFEAYAEYYLSDREKLKVLRLKSSKTKSDMIWSRILLKRLFAAHENISLRHLRQIEILNNDAENMYGFPLLYYGGKQQSEFVTISHYDGEIGVSCAPTPCGIDVVKAFVDSPEKSFIEYAFSDEEQSQLRNMEHQEKLACITLGWGIKEAISKYLGCGLRYGPRTVSVKYSKNRSYIYCDIHHGIDLSQCKVIKDICINYFWNSSHTYCYVYASKL